jgi:2-polyprenyl-6-hydroxyphenyl methylase/3-demethylubiquinone-9 3-methyltransferase
MARAADLSVFATQGMGYNPLTQRYRLTPDTSVNYLLACRKPGG